MSENRQSVMTCFEPLQTERAEASWLDPDLGVEPAEDRGKRILVAEDEAAIRACLRMMLEMEGHQVTEASDGAEALRSFTIGHFDLVITDLEMPVMRGNELAVGIKQLAPSVPILMITASACVRRDADNPVDELISKPFMVSDLHDALRRLLLARSGSARSRATPALEVAVSL